jgi:hypothetical protein
MKTAILLSGPLRGNDLSIQSHLNMVGDYDIFVSCLNNDVDDWKTSNWKIKNLFVTPEVDFSKSLWANQRYDEYVAGIFWQYTNLRNVILQAPKDYDVYIRSRNDLIFYNKLPIDLNLIKENVLYNPDRTFSGYKWNGCGTMNDQFWISDWKVMEVISRYVIEEPMYTINEFVPETGLVNWIIKNNINYHKFDGFNYIKII